MEQKRRRGTPRKRCEGTALPLPSAQAKDEEVRERLQAGQEAGVVCVEERW